MSKKSLVILVLAVAGCLPGRSLLAQAAPPPVSDQDIQLLRQDVRAQKKQLVAANMTLTPAEAEKFWPVYEQYTAEGTKLGDERVQLIKEYATSYQTLTDATADSLIKKSIALEEKTAQLRMKYVPIFEKVISPKKTAAFFQIDRRLSLIIDLQLASQIPLATQ